MKYDYQLLNTYAKAVPGKEHTRVHDIDELNSKEYVSYYLGEGDPSTGIAISSTIEDGKLKIIKRNKLCHVLAIANSGAGKTQGFASLQIISASGNETLIVLDPKSELSRATYAIAMKIYGEKNVSILNLMNPDASTVFVNPFEVWANEWIESKRLDKKEEKRKDITSALRKYIETIFPIPKTEKDSSWYVVARNFIFALVLGCFEDLDLPSTPTKKQRRRKLYPQQINWFTLVSIFESFAWGESYRGFNDRGFFTSRDKKKSQAYKYAKTILDNAGSTRANYAGFIELYLRRVSDTKIQKISMFNNLTALDLVESPQILYIVYDLSDKTVREYLNIIISSLCNDLLQLSHTTNGGKLKTPVMILMDEFPALRANEIYPNILATGRGSGLFLTLICQSLSQLKARYPEEFKTILQNSDATFFLGTNDVETANEFSAQLGKTSIADPVQFLRNEFNCIEIPCVSTDILMHHMREGEAFIKVNRAEPIHGHFEFFYNINERFLKSPITDINMFHIEVPINHDNDMSWLYNDEADDGDDDF